MTVLQDVLTHRSELRITSVCTVLCVLLLNSGTALSKDWCAIKVKHRDNVIVPRIDKPRALQTYTDPAFGTRITRVTNAPYGTAHRTLYSTVQPWNADESFLLLYHSGDSNAGHHLYNGKTYEYIRPMEFVPADIEEIYWDEDDSDTLYFIQKRPDNDALYGKLVKYNVKTRQRSLLADLDPVCGNSGNRAGITAMGGNDIQGIAGATIGLRCVNNDVRGNSSDITFNVNVRTGQISPQVTLNPAQPQGANTFGFRPDVAAVPMQSGRRVVIQDSVFDNDMNYLYPMDGSMTNYTATDGRVYKVPKTEHSSAGQMPNGHDAIFSPRYEPMQNGCDGDSDAGQGALVAQDIQSGNCRVVVGLSTGWGYPLSGVHLSAVSPQNPGWVTMTSIGNRQLEYLTNGRPAPTLFSELSLTHADPDNPTTCRIAHLRTLGKSARRGASYGGGYFGEPHAVMSPSGSRVLFNSDWYDSGSVDTYAVNLEVTTTSPNTSPVALKKNLVANPASDTALFGLKTLVRMQETPPRVYVDFADTNQGPDDRVAISRAGSADNHLLMWLYTNGTQQVSGRGPQTGRLSYLQQYIGQGDFEARLYINGDFTQVVKRTSFSIP